MSLAPIITSTCHEYFGRVVKHKLVDNRCGACPLRGPCVTWGGKQPRTLEENQTNNDVFAREAAALLGAAP